MTDKVTLDTIVERDATMKDLVALFTDFGEGKVATIGYFQLINSIPPEVLQYCFEADIEQLMSLSPEDYTTLVAKAQGGRNKAFLSRVEQALGRLSNREDDEEVQ